MLIEKTKGNQRYRNTSKKTDSRNKLYICHCKKHKVNRKWAQYHCYMCGKAVLKFNLKHPYVACVRKEKEEVRFQKEKDSKGTV